MSDVAQLDLVTQQKDARARTLTLIAGLDESQLMGPHLPIVNPLRWEIGHAAYFYEYWILRQHFGEHTTRDDVDRLYDSIGIAHDDRWDLPLPSLTDTLAYMDTVLNRVSDHLIQGGEDPARDYLTKYAIFHEDMHTEAFTYTRQTLAYPTPSIGTEPDIGWIAGQFIEPKFLFKFYGFSWVEPWGGDGMYVHFAFMGFMAFLGLAVIFQDYLI